MTNLANATAMLHGSIEFSEAVLQKFAILEELVRKWNPTINVVARSTLPDFWDRHIVDSTQVYLACPLRAGLWLDLGSGGGFPGIVVSILAHADVRVVMVESDRRKTAFLREAIRILALNSAVECLRIEDLPAQKADVVSARALASLTHLCGYAHVHMKPTGIAVFPKGRHAEEEVAIARENWTFDLESHQSLTGAGAAVLCIRNLSHV